MKSCLVFRFYEFLFENKLSNPCFRKSKKDFQDFTFIILVSHKFEKHFVSFLCFSHKTIFLSYQTMPKKFFNRRNYLGLVSLPLLIHLEPDAELHSQFSKTCGYIRVSNASNRRCSMLSILELFPFELLGFTMVVSLGNPLVFVFWRYVDAISSVH